MNEEAQRRRTLRRLTLVRQRYAAAEEAVRAAAADSSNAKLFYDAVIHLGRTDRLAGDIYDQHVVRVPADKNDLFEELIRPDLSQSAVALPRPWLIDVTYAGYRNPFGSHIPPILDVWECQLLDRLLAKPGRDT